MIRALHRAIAVGDDQAHVRISYRADTERLAEARLTGVVPAAVEPEHPPVVLVLPGINVAPDSYAELVRHLARKAIVVTYTLVGDLGPAGVGITPGIDLAALAPDVAGSRPSATAIAPVLALLATMDESDPVLAGRIDIDRVVLLGHSAGGTVALHNARPEWFAGVRASVAIAAHTMTSTSLGHEPATITPLPAAVPTLLLSGGRDGVIAASADRYGTTAAEHDPVHRTFAEGGADNGYTWFVELADATHFCICDETEPASGRAFLDPADAPDQKPIRAHGFAVIEAFIDRFLGGEGEGRLLELVDAPVVSRWARR